MIWDSHAIATYLVDKYAKNDQLYPKDLQTKTRCNQRLFFETSLFERLRDCTVHVVFRGSPELPQDKIEPFYATYEMLESFLMVDPFLVGIISVADIIVACTITVSVVFVPLKSDKHQNIIAWLDLVKSIPLFDEMNTKYVDEFRQIVKSIAKKNRLKN